jgi:glucose-1-phosphate adenylyltransferase
VEDSILFEGVEVGRYARIRRAIIDKGVVIPQHAHIGYDHDEDRRRGFVVSDGGIVVLAKAHKGEEIEHTLAAQPSES